MIRQRNSIRTQRRLGAALVEMAVVTPVFGIFLVGLMEFGHVYMVINSLNAAAKKAARIGVADGVSTSVVSSKVDEILSDVIDTSNLSIQIKDAGVFDNSGVDAETVNYASLADIELNTMEPRQLFIVRVSVPYNDIAILPPFWVKDITLTGQSVMRHE